MLIQNNGTKPYTIGFSIIQPGKQVEVPSDFYDDVSAIADLQVISGVPADGGKYNPDVPAMIRRDGNGNANGIAGGDNSFLYGSMSSGKWMKIPSIFRLRITGSGLVTIDSMDAMGAISANVASYSASGATNQIEFPYAGDDAVFIRATLSGTTTCEVI